MEAALSEHAVFQFQKPLGVFDTLFIHDFA
jgi:hypothetical protein